MLALLLALAQSPREPVLLEAIAVDEDQSLAGLCGGDLDGDGDRDLVLAIAGTSNARSRDPILLRGRLRGGGLLGARVGGGGVRSWRH